MEDSEQQVMDTVPLTEEEEQAQQIVREYDELLEIKEKLNEDSSQYELHVRYIELLKKLDVPEELEAARVAMHDIYPLTEALWLDWIQDVKKKADTVEEQARLLELYDQAQQDYLCMDVWKDYVEYQLEKFQASFPQDAVELDETLEDYIANAREDILKAVRATTAHVKQSQEIWRLYAEFELNLLNQFKKDEAQLARVQEMYLSRLAIIHMDYEETFNAYSSFISNYHNTTYEASMVEANKIYAKTKAAAEDRDRYELQLTTTGYTLDTFYQYIEHERWTKNMYSLNNIRALYERAILIYCTDAGLWDDYILFLIEKARVQAFLESTCLRAIRNCPWSGVLWAHLARIMESGEREDEQIENIFDRALSTKVILSSVDELVTVLLAKCDFKRRKIDWEDIDEDAVLDLRVTFEESLEYVAEAFPKAGDPYFRIEKYYAYITLKRLGDAEKTREIWDGVVQKQGLNTEAWVQYILFERDQGNYQKCSTLFKKAIQKNIDNPVRLIDVWTTVEHEIGTLESYEQALVKINIKNKILTKQWSKYEEEKTQVKEVNVQEKKLMDRKKKSAHRIAQKQRAKEKKEIEKKPFKQSIEKAFNKNESKAKESVFEDDQASEEEEPEEKTKDEQPEINERKRKLSVESEENQVKKPKPSESFAKPAFIPKPRSIRPNTRRGKSVKLGQRALSRNDVSSNTTMTEGSSTTEDKPKSNDDFRAMLLGKK